MPVKIKKIVPTKRQLFQEFLRAYYGENYLREFCKAFGLRTNIGMFYMMTPDKIPEKIWAFFAYNLPLRQNIISEEFNEKMNILFAQRKATHAKRMQVLRSYSPEKFRDAKEAKPPKWLKQPNPQTDK